MARLIFLMLVLFSLLAQAEEPPAQFVADQSCAECHRQQHRDWSQSHHAWAMRKADDATVKGDFNGVSFEHFGVTTRFFKRDDKFMVSTV